MSSTYQLDDDRSHAHSLLSPSKGGRGEGLGWGCFQAVSYACLSTCARCGYTILPAQLYTLSLLASMQHIQRLRTTPTMALQRQFASHVGLISDDTLPRLSLHQPLLCQDTTGSADGHQEQSYIPSKGGSLLIHFHQSQPGGTGLKAWRHT